MGAGLPGQERSRTTRPVPAQAVDQFIAKQVDFAGSDSALKDDQVEQAAERCGGNEAWNLPLVFGPVAMAYNLEGVDKLVVNGDVLAKVFQGQIKKWNDPAIASLNSGATLPDADIKPIYRSDSSGTTDNFQKYLAAAAPQAWTKEAGKRVPGRRRRGRAEVVPVSCRPSRRRPVQSATWRRASPSRPVCRSPRSTMARARSS